MWMLNFPFPYDDAKIDTSFVNVRGLLLAALQAPDRKRFQPLAAEYVAARTKFFAELAPEESQGLELSTVEGGNRPIHTDQVRFR